VDNEQYDKVFEKIDKEYGAGSIMWLGKSDHLAIKAIPTGSLALDWATGIGGIPRGRITEVFGQEMSGKSTLCQHIIAEVQHLGLPCAYVDMEHALDPEYATACGVDLDRLAISQPTTGEEALNIARKLVRSGLFGAVIVDSVAALVPKAEFEGDIGDSVIYETPVYIRRKGSKRIEIVQIGDLFKKGNSTGWYTKTKTLEILTHDGWRTLLGVQRKENRDKKPIVFTRTSTGYVGTTKDHSLFVNGKEASPTELRVFDRLDTYTQSIEHGCCNVMHDELAWLLGFYVAEGSTPRTKNFMRFEVCNTERNLIEQCATITKKYFDTVFEIRTQRGEGTRKDLHVLTCCADSALGWYMQLCVSASMTKQVPELVLNGSSSIKEAFLQGFWCGDGSHSKPDQPRKYFNNSWPVMAGIQFLEASLGRPTNVIVSSSRVNQLVLVQRSESATTHPSEIIQFYDGGIPEFLYDISTESGTFVSAIGNIICHNSHMGLQARMMSSMLRMINPDVQTSETALIFTNQMRMKIGLVFGNPEVTTGGNALKFYASMRLELRKKQIKEDGHATGHLVTATVAKNKVAAPFRKAEFEITFGMGIDKVADILDLAVRFGVVTKKGAFYSYIDTRVGQGRDSAKAYLREHSEMLNKIEFETRAALGAGEILSVRKSEDIEVPAEPEVALRPEEPEETF